MIRRLVMRAGIALLLVVPLSGAAHADDLDDAERDAEAAAKTVTAPDAPATEELRRIGEESRKIDEQMRKLDEAFDRHQFQDRTHFVDGAKVSLADWTYSKFVWESERKPKGGPQFSARWKTMKGAPERRLLVVVFRYPHFQEDGKTPFASAIVPDEKPVAHSDVAGLLKGICPVEHTARRASTSHESSGMTPARAISGGRRPSGAA